MKSEEERLQVYAIDIQPTFKGWIQEMKHRKDDDDEN